MGRAASKVMLWLARCNGPAGNTKKRPCGRWSLYANPKLQGSSLYTSSGEKSTCSGENRTRNDPRATTDPAYRGWMLSPCFGDVLGLHS